MYMVLYIQPDLCSKVDLCYPAGATFGNPHGNPRNKVVLSLVKPSQLLDVERKNDTAEKLARSLLLLLFTHSELASGNCTRPVREDIKQLNSERLWAIKCKPPPPPPPPKTSACCTCYLPCRLFRSHQLSLSSQ